MRTFLFRFFRLIPLASAVLALGAFAVMHLQLKASVPAADSAVRRPPSQILLIFSARPEAALSRVQLLGPDSTVVKTGKPAAGGDSLSLAIPVTERVGNGKYIVRWRAAGRDGHPATGEFDFTVGGAGDDNAAAGAVSRDHSAN